jgi:hypothetical protein
VTVGAIFFAPVLVAVELHHNPASAPEQIDLRSRPGDLRHELVVIEHGAQFFVRLKQPGDPLLDGAERVRPADDLGPG